jgi:hypothetical protein
MRDERKDRLMVIAVLVGAFVGFWTAFALFFTYPEPLGFWAHPVVWAAGGAGIGLGLVIWRAR